MPKSDIAAWANLLVKNKMCNREIDLDDFRKQESPKSAEQIAEDKRRSRKHRNFMATKVFPALREMGGYLLAVRGGSGWGGAQQRAGSASMTRGVRRERLLLTSSQALICSALLCSALLCSLLPCSACKLEVDFLPALSETQPSPTTTHPKDGVGASEGKKSESLVVVLDSDGRGVQRRIHGGGEGDG